MYLLSVKFGINELKLKLKTVVSVCCVFLRHPQSSRQSGESVGIQHGYEATYTYNKLLELFLKIIIFSIIVN